MSGPATRHLPHLMTPGPTLVLACPVCGALVRQRSLASGNTFGATLWSDGRFDAPMLPDAPALALCAGGHWFWLADAAEVGEHHWFRPDPDTVTPPEWDDAPFAEDLDGDGYAAALAAGLGSTRDREAHLRLRLWWASNDAHRGTGTPPTPDLDNLRRLQSLFTRGRSERGEPVLHAAVAHALGERDAALDALARSSLPPDMNAAFQTLVSEADLRVTALSGSS